MSRFLRFALVSAVFSSAVACSQDIKHFVKNSSVEVKSIAPDNEDFSDLEAIGNAIGDARVVMLGEQDHGDAPTFLAKTRLIKYLHEKKGFSVLAFESDFFALNFGWDHTEKVKAVTDSFIKESIYPIWTRCKACSELFFQYIPATQLTKSRLTLTGFDNQISTGYSMRHLGKALDSVLRAIDLPVLRAPKYSERVMLALKPVPPLGHNDTTLYNKHIEWLEIVKDQLTLKAPDQSFWTAVVQNLIELNKQYQTMNTDRAASMNIRDQVMAKNLTWLCNSKYKEQKIIVWAANYHIARSAGSYMHKLWKKNLVTMGSGLAKDKSLNESTYVLGFSSYEGEAGRMAGPLLKYKIEKPSGECFEKWINPDFAYAFTNFRSYPGKKFNSPSFKLRGFGHAPNQNEQWTNIFDGVFFIRKMYSCIE